MTKILLLSLLITPAFAQDGSEEAIILNQELQFLEEAADNVTILTAGGSTSEEKIRSIENDSLEQEYFGEKLENDDVSTRTAAPMRRSY